MDALQERLKALLAPDAAAHVIDELRRLRDEGVTQDNALQALESLRSLASTEAEEDQILDVMDIVSGFCSPHLKVW